MKREHFETLAPICPLCSAQRNESHRLKLATVVRERNDVIVEGVLHCSNAACQYEYPIIDGIPIIVADARTFVANNLQSITQRSDLSHAMQSLLGDCAGPGSAYENSRHHLSIYAQSHYADLEDGSETGGLVELLNRGWERVKPMGDGPILDVGCSVARTTFESALRCPEQLVLGVDLDFRMLQTAQNILKDGVLRFAKRRVGLVYDACEWEMPFGGTANVDFWLCNAAQLPFEKESFATVLGLNVLDCIASPIQILHQADRIVTPNGWLMLSSPYDWSASATALEAWIGGHSQRGPDAGSSAALLAKLLTPGGHPQSIRRLRLKETLDHLSWRLQLHDRFTAEYSVQMFLAQADSPQQM